MPRRTPLLAALAAAVALSGCVSSAEGSSPPPPASGPGPAAVTEAVVAAAAAFLAGLTPEQRERVRYDSDDPALREWSYFPGRSDRNGIAIGELTDEQRAAAFAVAEETLSDSGYAQLRGVLAAEDALGVRNGEPEVDSDRYFIAFFGEPSTTGRFTVQITGHHLAVNTTFEGDRISPTPAFTGVDPVDFEADGRRLRPMLAETEAFTALVESLGEDALAAARIGAIDDVRVGTGRSDRYPEPEGTLVSDLTEEQRGRVTAFVRAWVGDTDERVAEPLVQQYEAEFDRTRIAVSGSLDPDTPGAYLRIDGPRLWIEFSNVGRFGNGDNHYHSIYRDKRADYLGR